MIDRRIIKTKKAIYKAFIDLLKIEDIELITIQQIADEADINRATFYKHYEDKYMLLNEIEDIEIQKMKNHFKFNNHQPSDKITTVEIYLDYVPQKLIKLILNNIEVYEVLFNMKRTSELENKLTEIFKENLLNVLKGNDDINGIPFEYFYRYISGAMISTIKLWVSDSNRPSVEDLNNMFFKLITEGPLNQVKNTFK